MGVVISYVGVFRYNMEQRYEIILKKKIWQIQNKGVPLYLAHAPNQGGQGKLPLIKLQGLFTPARPYTFASDIPKVRSIYDITKFIFPHVIRTK